MSLLNLCHCGSASEYAQCCGPYHHGEKSAPSAEALMRSRYSAFVLQLEDYLLATWDKSKKPARVDFPENGPCWNKLEIIACKKGQAGDDKGIVEFKAHYLLDGQKYVMHEISRFVKRQGHWLYLDGAVKSVSKLGQTSNQGLNSACSCGSGKKFKRCCGAQ